MKTLPITRPILALLLLCLPLRAEDEIEKAFRDALYAEEVKGDTEAALKAYAEVAAKFEQQRDMAATALFRQAECLRKLGRKDEAAAMYKKVLAQYGDKERTAKLSRENLAALGMAAPDTPAAAAEQGSTDVARLEKLLKDSPDLINATDASNPLAAAAEKGQVALVDYLLGKGARVDTLVDGKAALHRAAEAGHLTVCQKLVEKGADVNLKTDKEATALLLALDKGRTSVAELLLEKKADVNAGKLHFFTPGKTQAVGTNNGIQTVATETERSETQYTLSLALARKAPAALVLRLIKEGADPAKAAESLKDSVTSQTWPLAEAIRLRDAAIIAAILEKGFSPAQMVDVQGRNSETNFGVWAMDLAMQQAAPSAPDATDDAIVELLRKHGADMKRRETVSEAVERGLSGYIRAAVKDGGSPDHLDTAITSRKPEVLKLLLELGAEPGRKEENAHDAMSSAIYAGYREAVAILREGGYPLKERIVPTVAVAAYAAFGAKPQPDSRAIFDELAAEAKKTGHLEEALTYSLANYNEWGKLNAAALIELGANAWKSPVIKDMLSKEQDAFGWKLPNFLPVWKAARIMQNEDLPTGVWASRGPSIGDWLRGNPNNWNNSAYQNYRPFFRAVVSETGIVPAGTLGRFLAAYGWDSDKDDLASLTVYRLDAERKIQELKVDFTAIAKAGDAAKDFPLQWGDAVEIPPRITRLPGRDSQADAARQEERAAIFKFIDALYAETDTRLLIGDGQLIVNAENEKGPVLRMKGTRDPLAASGLPAIFDPLPGVEIMRAGQEGFQPENQMAFVPGQGHRTVPYLLASAGHGDSVRIVPPVLEPALNDTALRNAFTLAVSEKGPYLRVFPEDMQDLLARFEKGYPEAGRGRDILATRGVEPVSDPFSSAPAAAPVLEVVPTRSLRNILLMLHGPNYTGFGPVNWPAAKLRLANKDGWEDLALDKADLSWPIVPGMMLVLPPLDPAAPIPPDTFDYAACAVEVEVTPGDLPPFKLRFQPPVPELKRSGDKWVWSYKRKDGDSPCAWPDLSTLLKNAPALKDWPGYAGEITLKSGQKVSFDHHNLQSSGGLWLQPDWKGISLTRKEAPPQPSGPAFGVPMPPQPSIQGRTRVVLPQPAAPSVPPNN